eukprot:TRINITY_DN37600_c0_g1_i1.p1 TRINITY_DN37600_c0_g1~~TRINITY_DN37600_c0_g1_i1.p1  ORF type:complete len:566 (+),score=206.61 TRINITY_DN37600_c0_g1_i1:227-1699(+)
MHAGLAMLCTAQVVLTCGQDTPFVVASRSSFAEAFLAPPVRRSGPFAGNVYTADDCMASVSHVISTFFSLSDRGLDSFEEPEWGQDTPTAYLHVVQYQLPPRELVLAAARPQTSEVSTNITDPQQDWLSRLGVQPGRMLRRQFFARMVGMRLVLPLTTVHRELNHFQLFSWNVVLEYDFESRGGQIQVRLDATGSHGSRKQPRGLRGMHWELALDVLLGMAAATALVADLQPCGVDSPGSGGPMWRRMGAMADICVLIGAVLDAGELSETIGWHSAARFHFVTQLSVGLGCLLCWCRIMQHMEDAAAYKQLLETFRLGVPVVLRFVLSLLPVLIGFASLGVALFSEHTSKFESIDESFFTLFAVMNGDVVLDTIDSVKQVGLLGPLYLMTFVVLFIWVALSITISIIQDSYWTAKRGRRAQARTVRSLSPRPAASSSEHEELKPLSGAAEGDVAALVAAMSDLRDAQRRVEERLRQLQRSVAAGGERVPV